MNFLIFTVFETFTLGLLVVKYPYFEKMKPSLEYLMFPYFKNLLIIYFVAKLNCFFCVRTCEEEN